jgi:hypothetical protein
LRISKENGEREVVLSCEVDMPSFNGIDVGDYWDRLNGALRFRKNEQKGKWLAPHQSVKFNEHRDEIVLSEGITTFRRAKNAYVFTGSTLAPSPSAVNILETKLTQSELDYWKHSQQGGDAGVSSPNPDKSGNAGGGPTYDEVYMSNQSLVGPSDETASQWEATWRSKHLIPEFNVAGLFDCVHLGRAAERDHNAGRDPVEQTFEAVSSITEGQEAYHTSGDATLLLQDGFIREERAYRPDVPHSPYNLRRTHSGPPESPQLSELYNTFRDLGDLKMAISRNQSSEALSLLRNQLKDFGKSDDHDASLDKRLLGPDSGFEPISRFMGSDDNAESFITRILKRSYLSTLEGTIQSERWGKQKAHDAEAIAEVQANDVVSSYRGGQRGLVTAPSPTASAWEAAWGDDNIAPDMMDP